MTTNHDSAEYDDLETRLERLSKRVRRLRKVVITGSVILALFVLSALRQVMDPGESKPWVKADAFILQHEGKVRARLGFADDAGPGLYLLDEEERIRLRLELRDGAPEL